MDQNQIIRKLEDLEAEVKKLRKDLDKIKKPKAENPPDKPEITGGEK